MEIIMLIIHLLNGEIAKIPMGIVASELTCSSALEKIADNQEDKTAIAYNGVQVIAYYCKNNKGDWIP